jgi:Flp pilus assembly protein TadD
VTSGGFPATPLSCARRHRPRKPGQRPGQLRSHARLEQGDCAKAEPAFHAANAAGLPSADAFLGLADCLGRRGDLGAAEGALTEARRIEPGNQIVVANLGLLKASKGDAAGGIELLKSAIAADPDFLGPLNLALVYGRAGRVADAKTTAQELLARLPPQAPQRSEVERLLRALDGRP